MRNRPIPEAFRQALRPGEEILVHAWAGHNRPWWMLLLGFLCFLGPGWWLLTLGKVRYTVVLTNQRIFLGRLRYLRTVDHAHIYERARHPIHEVSRSILGEPILHLKPDAPAKKLTFYSGKNPYNANQGLKFLEELRAELLP